MVAVGNDAQFRRLLDVLGLADGEGRFATNAQRLTARAELAGWLGGRINQRRRDELVASLIEADVPAGPVNTVTEAVTAMGTGWTSVLDGIELAPSPISVDGARAEPRLPPPRLGEHTDAVLRDLRRDQAGR